MQPNVSHLPRGQFKGQISGQQIVTTGNPKTFMKPPLQYQFVRQQQQQQQQQLQLQPPQSQAQSQPQPLQQQPQQRPHFSNENQVVINQANMIRGQKGPGWGQQWSGGNDSKQQQVASHLLVSQTTTVDQQQMIHWQQQQQQEGNRKALPGQQPSVRLIQTTQQQAQQQFAFSNQASDQVRPTTTSTTTVESSQLNNSRCLNNSASQGANTAPPAQSSSVSTCLASTTCNSTLVTPKTKTTLANFLNTRLQNNTASVLSGNKISNDCQSVNMSQYTSQSFSTDGDGTLITSVSNCSPSVVTSFSIVPNKMGFVGSPGVVSLPFFFTNKKNGMHENFCMIIVCSLYKSIYNQLFYEHTFLPKSI